MKFFRSFIIGATLAVSAVAALAGPITKDLSAVLQIRRASPTNAYQVDSANTSTKTFNAVLVATMINDQGALKVDDYIPIERIFAVYQRDDNGVVYIVYAGADWDSVNMLRLRTMSAQDANEMISVLGTQVMLSHKTVGKPTITK